MCFSSKFIYTFLTPVPLIALGLRWYPSPYTHFTQLPLPCTPTHLPSAHRQEMRPARVASALELPRVPSRAYPAEVTVKRVLWDQDSKL